LKVLIIRLSAIGDTIHSLPVAASIKQRLPNAHIGWVVEPLSAPLLVGNPCVDEVFVLPRKEWMRKLRSPLNWPSVLTEVNNFWSDIRNKQFDVALDLQGLLKSALCAVASGAPKRVGFSHTREGSGLFLTDKALVGNYFAPDRHIVSVNLEVASYLFRTLGLPPVSTDEPIQFPLPAVPASSNDKVDKLIGRDLFPAVLIPGTTWPSKIWPSEKWTNLAKLIHGEMQLPVVLAGGPGDKEVNVQIAAQLKAENLPVIDITGETSLLDLIALYERSKLVIGSDSGPMHLAAATGKPKVIGVFGSTPYKRLEPLGINSRSVSLSLSCQPCFTQVCPLSTNACLNELSEIQVLTVAKELLAIN